MFLVKNKILVYLCVCLIASCAQQEIQPEPITDQSEAVSSSTDAEKQQTQTLEANHYIKHPRKTDNLQSKPKLKQLIFLNNTIIPANLLLVSLINVLKLINLFLEI